MNASELIEALQIMQKYGKVELQTDYDVIYAGPDASDELSPDDDARLKELGWFISTEYDCWMAYT